MLYKIHNNYPYTIYLIACFMSYILFCFLAEPMNVEHFPKSIGLEIEDLILTLIVCSFIFFSTNHKIYDGITMYQYAFILIIPFMIISTFVVYDDYNSEEHIDLLLRLSASILCLVSMYYGKYFQEVFHLHHQLLFFIFAILLNSKNDIRMLHAVCVGSFIHGISAYRFAQNIEHKYLSHSHGQIQVNKYIQ